MFLYLVGCCVLVAWALAECRCLRLGWLKVGAVGVGLLAAAAWVLRAAVG